MSEVEELRAANERFYKALEELDLEQIFASAGWMRVTPTECNIHVFGDVGMVACAENITASRDSDVGVAVAQATNLFRRTPEGWRMFHHHASPAPVRVTQPFSGTIQ